MIFPPFFPIPFCFYFCFADSFTEVSLEYADSVFDKPKDCHNIGGSRARRSTGGILDNLQEVIDL
jgi:hypothetical protein